MSLLLIAVVVLVLMCIALTTALALCRAAKTGDEQLRRSRIRQEDRW